MNKEVNLPPVLADDPAEGTTYRGNEPLDGLNGGLLPTLETERLLTNPVDLLSDTKQQPTAQPPTAETGVMPIVSAHEGAYDNDGQDATRTTAELQVVVAASTGR